MEDGLIAQHGILDTLLALTIGSNIAVSTNNIDSPPSFIASED